MRLHHKDSIQKKLGKLWRKWLQKVSYSTIHYQNILLSITGVFLIIKPMPIASTNILLTLDRTKIWNTISQISFKMYLKGSDSSFEEVPLSDEKMKTALFSIGWQKSWLRWNNYDIVNQNFYSSLIPLKCIFDLSLKSSMFLDKMKIVRVIPIFNLETLY